MTEGYIMNGTNLSPGIRDKSSWSPNPALFVVKDAPGAGRGSFAAQRLAPGTELLVADDLASYVLLREYRGEVCWECFAYDRGKKLPVRDPVHGFTFCSDKCAAKLRDRYNESCLQGWAAVEKALKSKKPSEEEGIMACSAESRPAASVIEQEWAAAAHTAASIRSARTGGPGVGKTHRRSLQHASSLAPPADVVNYQMQTVMSRHMYSERWAAVLSLADEQRPYASLRELQDHVRSYLFLVATLPEDLLYLVTPDTLRTIKSREVHNSFGIRSLEDGGAEFFGFGVWPSASYYNHSCRPNLRRRRSGRKWIFEATAAIETGEELQISYLGGEEETLSTEDRKTRLRKTWGFDCGCQRCNEE